MLARLNDRMKYLVENGQVDRLVFKEIKNGISLVDYYRYLFQWVNIYEVFDSKLKRERCLIKLPVLLLIMRERAKDVKADLAYLERCIPENFRLFEILPSTKLYINHINTIKENAMGDIELLGHAFLKMMINVLFNESDDKYVKLLYRRNNLKDEEMGLHMYDKLDSIRRYFAVWLDDFKLNQIGLNIILKAVVDAVNYHNQITYEINQYRKQLAKHVPCVPLLSSKPILACNQNSVSQVRGDVKHDLRHDVKHDLRHDVKHVQFVQIELNTKAASPSGSIVTSVSQSSSRLGVAAGVGWCGFFNKKTVAMVSGMVVAGLALAQYMR